MNWTPVMDETLKARRAAGVAYSKIAAELKVSKSACIGRADRLGLIERQQTTQERRAALAARYAAERLDRERAREIKREAALQLLRADLALGTTPEQAARRALANGASKAAVEEALRPRRVGGARG